MGLELHSSTWHYVPPSVRACVRACVVVFCFVFAIELHRCCMAGVIAITNS